MLPASPPEISSALILGAESALGQAVSARLGGTPRLSLGGADAHGLSPALAEVERVRALHGLSAPAGVLFGNSLAGLVSTCCRQGPLDAVAVVGSGNLAGADDSDAFAAAEAVPDGVAVVLVVARSRDGEALASRVADRADRLGRRGVRLNAVIVTEPPAVFGWERAAGNPRLDYGARFAEAARVARLLLGRDARALTGQTVRVYASAPAESRPPLRHVD